MEKTTFIIDDTSCHTEQHNKGRTPENAAILQEKQDMMRKGGQNTHGDTSRREMGY